MDDSRSEEEAPGTDLPRGVVYSSKPYVSARQTRIHSVLHVLHMAKFEKGNHEVLNRADSNGGPRILPTEPMAEYARHPSRVLATRRTSCVYGATRASSNTWFQLWNIWAGIRTLRKRSARTWQRGVLELGEIRSQST